MYILYLVTSVDTEVLEPNCHFQGPNFYFKVVKSEVVVDPDRLRWEAGHGQESQHLQG